MKLKKKFIKSNFDRASSSYDRVAFIQKLCATRLVSYLKKYFPEFYPHSILDLGTGTGYVTEILFNFFPQSKFILNDLSFDMLIKAQEKLVNKEVEVILADMEEQNFSFHNLVISNLALQWVNNLNNVIRRFYKNSDVFAFSCLLDGTFNEWSQIFLESFLPIPTYQYPLKQELESYLLSLKPSKYFFDSQEFKLKFSSSSEFIKYLKDLGANHSSHKISLAELKKIITTYKDEFCITYKVFFGVLGKCKSL
ncbi:MAG: methyltransferase domain-containing protein [Wolbachia endosymbiont of Fragariocoptes setiger]|nr:methyltransferase domain-containing protein [Wolbachia endosymbiont of Fragariocoptes setiger]